MIVFLASSISRWWSEWGSEEHKEYVKWRYDVKDAFVQAGHLVYSPHESFSGKWVERVQAINDFAIKQCDIFVYLCRYEDFAVSVGTSREYYFALGHAKPTFSTPPGHWYEIAHMLKPLLDPYSGFESAATHPDAYKREL